MQTSGDSLEREGGTPRWSRAARSDPCDDPGGQWGAADSPSIALCPQLWATATSCSAPRSSLAAACFVALTRATPSSGFLEEQAPVWRLETEFPGDVPLHVVLDNYGTHKHPRVRTWLARHPRFVLHFVPTSSSWLNLVERWFSELTSKRIRRGSFGSVEELQAAIDDFLTTWNKNPKPFVWTATVESIVEKLSRCRQTLERIAPGSTRSRARKTTK